MFVDVELEIPFHDVDMMHIVWHGHYLKYFEIARCALLDAFDYNYSQMLASHYAWPIVDCHSRFAHSAVFGQKIRVRATLMEWENRLRIRYRIVDAASGQVLTKGETVQVAVDMHSGELCYVSPAVLLDKLAAWPAFHNGN